MLNFKITNIHDLCLDYLKRPKTRLETVVLLSGLVAKDNNLEVKLNENKAVKLITDRLNMGNSGDYYSGRCALNNYLNDVVSDNYMKPLDLSTSKYLRTKVYPGITDTNDDSTVSWIDDSGHTRTESKNLLKNH